MKKIIKFSPRKIKHRLLQSTYSLMKEVGGISNVGTTKDGKSKRYAWKNNNSNILGIAHCDTINCGSDHVLFDKNRVWSSRLDDRLGVYVILDVLPKLDIKTDILLTDFEETGNSTAKYFKCDKKYNWIYQFDRSGDDVVTYQYHEIEEKLIKFFNLGRGTFSDISYLTNLGVCGFNVGTAYYNEHSLGSYANLTELKKQISRFKCFYSKYKNISIPHKSLKNYDYNNIKDIYDFDISLWNDPTRNQEIYDNWPQDTWKDKDLNSCDFKN